MTVACPSLSEPLFRWVGLPWILGLEGKTQTRPLIVNSSQNSKVLNGHLCSATAQCYHATLDQWKIPPKSAGLSNSPGLRWPKMGWSTLRNIRSPSLDVWEPVLNNLKVMGGLQWKWDEMITEHLLWTKP